MQVNSRGASCWLCSRCRAWAVAAVTWAQWDSGSGTGAEEGLGVRRGGGTDSCWGGRVVLPGEQSARPTDSLKGLSVQRRKCSWSQADVVARGPCRSWRQVCSLPGSLLAPCGSDSSLHTSSGPTSKGGDFHELLGSA